MATTGLSTSQISALKNMPGIDQKLLSAYRPTTVSSTPSKPQAPAPTASAPALSNNGTYSPYTPSTSNLDAQYKNLQTAMAPSAQEGQLNDQNTALDAQLRNLSNGQGVMNRNIADQPINLGFITGQQRSIEDRYALQRGDVSNRQQTLQAQLANLQNKRQSAIDVAKVGYDYGAAKDSMINNASQYNNDLSQRQFQNAQTTKQYNDSLTQQKFANSLASQRLSNASGSSSSNSPSSSVPSGGLDSSGGINFITAPKKTVLTSVQKTFAPAMSTKIQSGLTDEQLRLFMNDYTTTQNQAQQSISPQWYFDQWKSAAGVGGSSSATGDRTS